MEIDDIRRELQTLQGHSQQGDLASYRADVERLYNIVTGQTLRKCNCKDILEDALIEINYKLKKRTEMAKARLLNGVVLWFNRKPYTNANLTDKVARDFLAQFPMRTDWFDILPPAEEEKKEDAPQTEEKVKKTNKKAKK